MYKFIYEVSCPCELRNSEGQLLYKRDKIGKFVLPLTSDVKVIKGAVKFVGIDDYFYKISPPKLPAGWKVDVVIGKENRVASVSVYERSKQAVVTLDESVFNDMNVPEGCKVFMIFHEIGHLVFGPDENACDKYAFYHALAAGVSPFLCYVALRTYLPEHYNDRVVDMGLLLINNKQLKNDI